MDVVNVGIVGPGKIAERAHAPALAQVAGARLWSVQSRSRERAAEFAKRFGAAAPQPAHDSLEAMLADRELHALVLTTPDALHADQVVAAARAGKHVLVEKPLATSHADALRMVNACREADVRLGVAYHLRHHAGLQALVAGIRAGELGELRHLRAQWCFEGDPSNWRARRDVGRWWALAAVGTHLLDLVRWVMVPACGEVVEVKSLVTRERFGGPNDETSVVAFRFASGATAELTVSVLFDAPNRVEICGGEETAVLDGVLGPKGEGQIRKGDQPVTFSPRNPYVGQLADFVAAIRERRDPAVNGEEGARNVALLEQVDPR